jgi:hypothetical protein
MAHCRGAAPERRDGGVTGRPSCFDARRVARRDNGEPRKRAGRTLRVRPGSERESLARLFLMEHAGRGGTFGRSTIRSGEYQDGEPHNEPLWRRDVSRLLSDAVPAEPRARPRSRADSGSRMGAGGRGSGTGRGAPNLSHVESAEADRVFRGRQAGLHDSRNGTPDDPPRARRRAAGSGAFGCSRTRGARSAGRPAPHSCRVGRPRGSDRVRLAFCL